jgi:formate hydrogenlyase subunit 6/NADH:ubiquinone oxidoreductase subunit I
MRSELPLVNETLCTGCGDCVVVCPVACLDLRAALPWMPRPRDCVSCTLCAIICPADAIVMAEEELA